MMIDNPPAIVGAMTPAMRREVSCAQDWIKVRDPKWAGDVNIELYRIYMRKCMSMSNQIKELK